MRYRTEQVLRAGCGHRTEGHQGQQQGLANRASVTGVLLMAATGVLSASAQTKQASVPDAQVESSVLQALAKNPKLASEQISSTTVYGVVTLSGHVVDETTRALAEDVVSRTAGVTKVVDELTLGAASTASSAPKGQVDPSGVQPDTTNQPSGSPATDQQIAQQGSGLVLQSDGTYAPADPASQSDGAQASPDQQAAPAATVQRTVPGTADTQSQQGYGQMSQDNAPPSSYPQPTQGSGGNQGGYQEPAPGAPQGQYAPQGPYSQQQPPYSQQPQYGQQPSARQDRPYASQGQYGPPQGYPGSQPVYGQQGGIHVTVPAGTVVQLRVNQPIDSRHSPVGSSFSGVLQQDVVVGGYVAMPRGATLQGTVVDATSAGALKGRAELGLQLSTLTLGGLTYPVSSSLWSQASGDKAVRTVNSALGLGALGAIIGGVAGGGAGAAIGAGAGGAVGLGASAASGSGAVVVPPESLLTFRLNAPVDVATVSQAELNRLSYNAPAYGPPRVIRRYPAYYPYGPGYYYPRSYYRGYPY